MLRHVPLIVGQLQALNDILIALDQLYSRKSSVDSDSFGVVFHLMVQAVDTPVNRPRLTEIIHFRNQLVLRGMEDFLHQIIHALVFDGTDGDDRDSQLIRHFFDVDGAAVVAHFVHHIQCQHHRNVQLNQLQSEVQVSLNVGGVHNVDDPVRLFIEQEISRDDLLVGVRPQGINARQVHHCSLHAGF